MTTTQNLYDLNTTELLGPATQDQIEASNASGDTGAIMVDIRTGEVLTPGTWAAQEASKSNATRLAYIY
jgi:hypothetical protein